MAREPKHHLKNKIKKNINVYIHIYIIYFFLCFRSLEHKCYCWRLYSVIVMEWIMCGIYMHAMALCIYKEAPQGGVFILWPYAFLIECHKGERSTASQHCLTRCLISLRPTARRWAESAAATGQQASSSQLLPFSGRYQKVTLLKVWSGRSADGRF